ncbi:hypothetical protein Rsub_05032 [Raphidocelis subcapitata]|uniref:Uncharacterized protein n=1 Tax=Raphidocelis subcapitata TaxID=307507 RepID=A0A2V0P482_9CHLO|nr:hypothetical protein Rsub_05032 [Raphidocelis subcapitata]|eukprot:GBF92663.1 hypothetical protein Rsub_05032 [Raphidocelis subcapitata]
MLGSGRPTVAGAPPATGLLQGLGPSPRPPRTTDPPEPGVEYSDSDAGGASSSGGDTPADAGASAPEAAPAPAPAPAELLFPPAGSAPKLLVVEAFAGSYPVARAAPALADAGVARVVAYAGIELTFADKAPGHEEMGIEAAEDYMNLGVGKTKGDVTSTEVRSTVVEFVRSRVQAVDAVAVFGGPPCQSYSAAAADTTRFPARYKLCDAEHELFKALKANAAAEAARHDIRSPLSNGGVGKRAEKVLAAKLDAADTAATEARDRVEVSQLRIGELEVAAREEAAADAAKLQGSDHLVRAFLHLYKAVEAEAHARGVPCFLVMENPYSSRDRGLWNRPFMKITHLLELPRTTAADRERHSGKFKPPAWAWLRTAYINYCCFSADAPRKPTILFTNLPAGALGDRRCRSNKSGAPGGPDCKVPEGGEHTTVRLTQGAHERAIWPEAFVSEALRAVVGSAPGERAQLAAAAAGGADEGAGGAASVEHWPLADLLHALEPGAPPDVAAQQIAAMHELRARLMRATRSQREALALEAMEARGGALLPSLVAMLVGRGSTGDEDRCLAALGLLDGLAAMRRRSALAASKGLVEALAAIVSGDEAGGGAATPPALLLLATLCTSDITLNKQGRDTRESIRMAPGLAEATAGHVMRGTPAAGAAGQLLARLCLESGALHPVGQGLLQQHPRLPAALEDLRAQVRQEAGNAIRRLLKVI